MGKVWAMECLPCELWRPIDKSGRCESRAEIIVQINFSPKKVRLGDVARGGEIKTPENLADVIPDP